MESEGREQVQGRSSGGESARPASPANRTVDEALRLFADLERQMAGLRESLAAQERETERARRRESELAARVEELGQREGEVQRQLEANRGRAAQIAHEAEQLGARRQELDDLTNSMESQRAELELARLRAGEQARALEEQHGNRARELEQRLSGLDEREQRIAAQAASISRDRQAVEARAAELAEREASAAEAVAKAERRAKEAADALNAAVAEHQKAASAKDLEVAELRRRAAAAEKQASAAEAEAGRLGVAIREIAPLAERGKAFDAEIAARDALLAEAEGQVRAREARTAECEEKIESLEAEVLRLGDVIEQERSRASEAGERAKDRRAASAATAGRRSRLAAVRRALRQRADRLRQAGEAVRQRFEQAEQILGQRDQIHAARLALVESQRRAQAMEAKAAKTRATGGVFYAVATLVALAGLSWAISGQVAPSMYSASAEIRADSQGRDVTDDQLEEWRRVNEELLSDPQMMQEAAERMRMRGMTALADPGLMAERLRTDLIAESNEPGQMRLELTGKGAARTERELGTFVTALASRSNSTRDRRADGLGTVITETARAGDAPLDDTRVIYAAGIMGVLTGVFLLVGVGLWRRLASARWKFEQELSAEEGPAQWADAPIARR